MKLLVDGDILVYSVGFTCEQRWYEVDCPSTGKRKSFQTKKDVKLFNKDISKEDIELCRSAQPEQAARIVMSSMLKGWQRKFDTKDMKIFLTHGDLKSNFRYKLDEQYKANRKGSVKPIHYQMLRDYLVNHYDTEIVEGIEADDALGIAQTEDTIIISKDKDLLQVPGLHYNITKGKQIRASKKGKLELWRDKAGKARLTGTGFKWFCAQMLLGDDVDNIKGISRVGAVKAYKLLEAELIDSYVCEDTGEKIEEWEPLNLSKQEQWEVVKKIYKDKKREDLLVNAQLLWILREEDDWFDESKI